MNYSLPVRCLGTALALTVAAAVILIPSNAGAQAQAPTSKTETAPAGLAENGKRIYKTYGCYQCHGYAAHGGAAPKLGPNPISFSAFVRYTRQPRDSMPPYTTKVVSDKELADIYAFLQSLPPPPAAKDIPLLSND